MLHSKLPGVGTITFSCMSALATECGALNLSQGFPDCPAPPTTYCAITASVSAPDEVILLAAEQLCRI
ncbi:hypothetical protein [Kineobactrum salinum]|uniref:Uncharacterized protein n=1 Tax=Kineobactrum salinum TaxID=2708301 RepID=A0A6C0TW93_9GAMM|nr:hypothetical protein [Kineobactrum salinum]QIB64046.1 hypothetical protein G3T16_14325 [Kineobactrum salinum]